MEMEHINENTIRVLIKGEDLAARGFTFLDLLGNKDEIESFFYSILEEVDVEEEFKGSEAVTFQVMPKGDGLELFISKSNPHELSETFEAFRKERGGEVTNWLDYVGGSDDIEESEDDLQDDIDDLEDFIRQENAKGTMTEVDEESPNRVLAKPASIVFEFLNFELIICLANEIQLENVQTRLFEMDRHYYLEIEFLNSDISKNEINNIVAHMSEYSRKALVSGPMLVEHGSVLMANDALESIRTFFPEN